MIWLNPEEIHGRIMEKLTGSADSRSAPSLVSVDLDQGPSRSPDIDGLPRHSTIQTICTKLVSGPIGKKCIYGEKKSFAVACWRRGQPANPDNFGAHGRGSG